MNRRGNGLSADSYAPLVDLTPRLADVMLTALREAGVAAYAASAEELAGLAEEAAAEDVLDRLYVDVEMKPTAESVLRVHLTRLRDPERRDTDLRDAGLRETDLRDAGAREPELREPELRDTEAREREPRGAGSHDEPRDEPRESEVRDTEVRDTEVRDTGLRDSDLRDADLRDAGTGRVDLGKDETGGAARTGGPGRAGGTGDLDEEAIWAAIVAGYDAVPEGGRVPWPDQENLDEPEPPPRQGDDRSGRLPRARVIESADVTGLPAEEDREGEEGEEGHYVPPPPPPLPSADPLTKGAWLCLVGGPLYLLVTVILDWEVPGWAAFLAVAAFIGGFVTLVLRMGDEPRDPDDGAVV
ncbi:hypothetical protein GCM10023085_79820 [Actinomadura viridis]|uniref:DUF308 domain-containing protein n=1 Tax=Actinomadura viridis TaxID=58110 RepID=A0A931DGN6_9ACTN|nr:hypothetical protein [Actinomadura viridis]MBG6088273.1 hypothetical protein [Actinomadura viridis]